MNIAILSAFIIYFASIIGIGIFFYRRSKTATDFMVGSHSMNYWVTAIATQASDMSSWLFLGLPAMVFVNGLFEYWTALGLMFFMLLTWQFIAPKLRERSGSSHSLTFSSFLGNSFPHHQTTIRLVSALFTIAFFTVYICAGLVGLGRIFASSFDIGYHTAITLSITGAALYTLVGGYVGIAWCNMLQGIFLLAMVILVPVAGLFHVGGIHAAIESLHTQGVSLTLFKNPRDLISALLLAAGWGLGYFGQPHVLFNFMGIDDPKKITYAKYVGMSWMFIALTAATCVGLVGVAFFATVPLASPEFVFVTMAKTLFHPFVAGLVLCAILAATFSTMDAQIFISGTTFAEDICRVFVPHISSHQLVTISRVGAVAVSAIALFFAWDTQTSVYDLVNYAWAGLGSALGPVTISSLYTRKLTPEGALASIFAGGCTSALWPYFNASIMPLVPGFAVGLIALFTVSYITRK